MAQKMITFVFVQAIIFQVVYSQLVGRIGGCGCGGGCGCSNLFPIEQLIGGPYLSTGQAYLPSGLTYSPPCPTYLPPAPVVCDQPTTIIQDSTVANNLANALQLLVVSNLLSNTLPLEQSAQLAIPANIAPLELISASPFALSAPSLVAPSLVAPYSQCGCGGCGCNGCGLGPYSVLY